MFLKACLCQCTVVLVELTLISPILVNLLGIKKKHFAAQADDSGVDPPKMKRSNDLI